jgi:hypothetical protein
MTLYLIYIEGAGIRGAARYMCKAESTIKANLDQADHALSQWFTERQAAKPRGGMLATAK